MKMNNVMVQFIPCGHYYESDDPEHVRKDAERAAKGYIDALILPSEECDQCKSLNENYYVDPLYLDYWHQDDAFH